jgi:hypothetical protein
MALANHFLWRKPLLRNLPYRHLPRNINQPIYMTQSSRARTAYPAPEISPRCKRGREPAFRLVETQSERGALPEQGCPASKRTGVIQDKPYIDIIDASDSKFRIFYIFRHHYIMHIERHHPSHED